MTTYYLDSSALSKRYVEEDGSNRVWELTKPNSGHLLLTARITAIELHSAVARRRREGTVSVAACETALMAFEAHCNADYDFVELDAQVVAVAQRLLVDYPLRAYDATQLASALVANLVPQETQLPPLIFLSADERLNMSADAEGLVAENPSDQAAE
jgi:predicted nucleic acid-binding protein